MDESLREPVELRARVARLRRTGRHGLLVLALVCAAPALRARPAQEPPSDPAAAIESPNERKRLALLESHRRIQDSFDNFFGGRWIAKLEADVAAVPAGAPLTASFDLRRTLAEWLMREGKVEQAIGVLDRLAQDFGASGEGGPVRAVELLKALAVANFRLGEVANCVCSRTGESCVFPLSAGGRHQDRRGAEMAARYLEKALEFSPDDLEAAWILNVAHMALGSHPDGVPPLFRIAPERFASEYDVGRFENVAHRVGVSRRSCAGAGLMDDFDGDGDLDVIASGMDLLTPLAYYRNHGDGHFTDVAKETGLDAQLGGLNAVHGDLNGDGRLDLYIPRGAWMMQRGEIPHSLVVQQPDGSFLDTSEAAGIAVAAPSQVAALADIDQDGDLDLFVGCEGMRTPAGWRYPSHLFRNRGDGRFEDVTQQAGVANDAFCKGAAFGDFDADGFPDLYVSNGSGANRLYHNRGDGSFVDRAAELGVTEPIESFATWWFDVNQDGWLDLFVANYSTRVRTEQISAYYKNGTSGLDRARLYVNDGKGGFREAGREFGLDRPMFVMGANFGDFDEDGYPDVYLGTGDPQFASLWPNVALRNDRGRRFQDVTTSGGFGHLQKGHGVAFGDIDADGDEDLFVEMGGAFRDDAFWDVLYENPGHGNHWLTVRTRGTRSNRSAIGARIRVRIEEEAGGERDVFAFVGTGGSFGGSSLQAEMGLGRARRIVELEIRWPAAGSLERFADVPLDRTIAVVEGEGRFTAVETRSFEL